MSGGMSKARAQANAYSAATKRVTALGRVRADRSSEHVGILQKADLEKETGKKKKKKKKQKF